MNWSDLQSGKYLNAELHTDLLGKDKRDEIAQAGRKLSALGTALLNSQETKGNLIERYRQNMMAKGLEAELRKNPEFLSILSMQEENEGKTEEEIINAKASVINHIYNQYLQEHGYKGKPVITIVTDVNDPNGNFYMSETSNEMVVDRESLLRMTKDDLLYIIGHEFGHFSIADDKTTKDQTVSQYVGNRVKEESSTLEAKEASESTWKMLAKNSNIMTGASAKERAEAISMEDREYHTLEYFITGGVASNKITSGVRGAKTFSYYTSFDLENDRAVKYSANITSIGVGNDDFSAAAGIGIYWKDTPEEMKKLSVSYGGSFSLGAFSLGIDFLAEEKFGRNFLMDIIKIGGFRIYIGKSKNIAKYIIPANVEKHATVLDIGNINIIKDTNILDYWENENIPTGARLYYEYNHKKGREQWTTSE